VPIKRIRIASVTEGWLKMPSKKLCPVCGVAKRVTKEHEWLDNGTIVQKENPDHRMIFIETENVASTFAGAESIINMSIERIIIEAKRRATYDFVDHTIPGIVKAIIRVIGMKPVIKNIDALGSVMGYGDISLVGLEHRYGRDSVAKISIKEPYSLPLFSGDLCGAFNAIRRREVGVEYEQVGPDEYLVTGTVSAHPIELQERLQSRVYQKKAGDITFEKCPKCGGPMALSEFKWDMDRGVIEHRTRGRRMALLGPATLDAVIDELEEELGDTILAASVEAQRRFIKTGFYALEEIATPELFRMQLAIRGLGNMKDLEWFEGGLRFRIENPCLNPIIAGMALGFFEMASGAEAHADWKETDDGDLVVEISSGASEG
jgi:hypothetical protein